MPDKPVAATGASLTAFTVTVKLCESDKSPPSVTLAVNVSLPLKFSGALKFKSLPVKVAVISVPPDMLNVALSPSSTSDADKLKEPLPSSSKDTLDIAPRTGASLTGLTVNVNVSELNKSPSLTVTVKDSLPLKLSAGVNARSLPDIFAVT